MVIYCLIDPRNNEIRYVGQTIIKINSRLNQHKYQWKRCNGNLNHLNSWIKNLSLNNLVPIIEILEEVSNIEELDFWEQYYISLFKSWNIKLVNSTLGGGGIRGLKMSEQSKAKRLESLKSSTLWEERNKRHSLIMKDLHKKGITKLGYSHLTNEKRLEIRLKISKNSKYSKPIHIKNIITNEELNFESIVKAAKYLNCSISTIKDFVHNKRKRSNKLKNFINLK